MDQGWFSSQYESCACSYCAIDAELLGFINIYKNDSRHVKNQPFLSCQRSNLFYFQDSRAILLRVFLEILVFLKLDPHPIYLVQVLKSIFLLNNETLFYSLIYTLLRKMSYLTDALVCFFSFSLNTCIKRWHN